MKVTVFRRVVQGAAIGWTVSALFLTPPLKEWEGIVILVLLVVIFFLDLISVT